MGGCVAHRVHIKICSFASDKKNAFGLWRGRREIQLSFERDAKCDRTAPVFVAHRLLLVHMAHGFMGLRIDYSCGNDFSFLKSPRPLRLDTYLTLTQGALEEGAACRGWVFQAGDLFGERRQTFLMLTVRFANVHYRVLGTSSTAIHAIWALSKVVLSSGKKKTLSVCMFSRVSAVAHTFGSSFSYSRLRDHKARGLKLPCLSHIDKC